MPSGTCWRRFFASSLDVVFFLVVAGVLVALLVLRVGSC